jgi:hypothetical protein
MATAPLISFRTASAPYPVTTFFSLFQSSIGGNNLPVLQGEVSNAYTFRIYNNFTKSAGIATAVNVQIGLFDGVGLGSHTAVQSLVSQSWVRIYETGFGESAGAPGLYTQYTGTDTAIGGSPPGTNIYVPDVGSDGSTTPYIRAGTDTNGVGFIEVAVYAEMPDTVGMFTWSFAISVHTEWTT